MSVDRETGWFDFGKRLTDIHMWLDHHRAWVAFWRFRCCAVSRTRVQLVDFALLHSVLLLPGH